jgi:hypothetical protein
MIMSDINTHLKRMAVYLEGRKAFEDSKQRGFNPYIRSNPEFALHWWNGWDAAKKESMADRPAKRKS